MKYKSRIVVVFSVLLYIAALLTTAYSDQSGDNQFSGFICLLIGWLGVFYDPFAFAAWLANVTYFTAFMLSVPGKKRKLVAWLSIISFVLVWNGLFVDKLMINEGGTEANVSVGVGYFLWVGSIALMFIKEMLARLMKA